MKNIWIINQYATTPSIFGDGHRHYYLAKEFNNQAYKTTIITSSFNHFLKRNLSFKGLSKYVQSDVNVFLLKTNTYKKTQGVGRVINMFVFLLMLFIVPKREVQKPDIIIVSSISLLPILYAIWHKLFNPKCKFILEIRDIWPLTLIEVGGYSSKNIFVKFLSWVEKIGYKKADYITSLLVNTNQHIENVLGNKSFKYNWISNGYFIGDNNLKESLDNSITKEIPANKFLVGYAGALGNANAMEYIIKAFNEIDSNNIALCIIGKGDKKEDLRAMSKRENVFFFESIPKAQVQDFLSKMDLLYLGSKNIPLYRFGISANKIFDYMYSGKPIIMSGNMNNDPISLAECGKVVPPEDSNEIIKAIQYFMNISEMKRKEIGDKGKKSLLKYFTYEILAKRYILIFEELEK